MSDNKWLRLLAYVTGLVNQELLVTGAPHEFFDHTGVILPVLPRILVLQVTKWDCDAGVRVSMSRPRFRWSSISAELPIMRA